MVRVHHAGIGAADRCLPALWSASTSLPKIDYCLLVGWGYEISVIGVPRSFRDKEAVAYDAARLTKARWPNDLVQIRKPDGSTFTMLHDGRTV